MSSSPSIRGLILAAGFGTRLKPITGQIPKPLLPVGGATLLDHAVAAFDRGGIQEIAVNNHHLGELVTRHLQKRPDFSRFTHFPETEILGTGGALHGAREFLAAADYFLVFNGDVLCDVDLESLIRVHLESGRLATLLLIDRPEINSVLMAEDHSLVHIRGASSAPAPELGSGCRALTYAGIGIFSRHLLEDIGPGFSSLITPLVKNMEMVAGSVAGSIAGNIGGFVPDGVFWDDLGTLPRFLQVNQKVNDCPEDFVWLEESQRGLPLPLRLQQITGHGSDRHFWRLSTEDWSAVAMQCPDTASSGNQEDDFVRHLAIGDFLFACGLGTAETYSVDQKAKTLLMEDLGQASLLFLAGNPGTPAERLADRYRQVVDHLLQLQSFTTQAQEECPLAVDRCLDLATLRWETDYFREYFLQGYLGLDPKETQELDPDFSDLAQAVAKQPLVLLHRDFQSQNIHFKAGQVRPVDFQGLRMGPWGYDIMSLVMDPYVALPETLRDELLKRFVAGSDLDPVAAEAMLTAAGLQRLMQALGAFGFLGQVKGKTGFLNHIPRGLENLRFLLAKVNRNQGPGSPYLPGPLTRLAGFLDD